MRRILSILALIFCSITFIFAQDASFSVKVSTDSILLGNKFRLVFTLENASGDNFEAPPFSNFHILSGPNVSSNYSMINGTVSQSVSYSFYLEPKDIGNYFIEPASIFVEGEPLETTPIEILVVPNPEGIIQEDLDKPNPWNNFEFQFGELFPERISPLQPKDKQQVPEPQKKSPKKKRKIYKL